jgi:SAM-dependent methyltransferase
MPEYRSVDLSQCVRCGLVFHGGAPAGIQEEYANGEYVTTHADHFNEDCVFMHIAEQRARWLLQRVSPGTLLELGPGRGFFLDAVRRVGFDPVGVEPSPVLTARAVSDFGVEVECGFLDEVDLSRDYFDVICMFHVFEHVEDPVHLLDQLGGLLSDRGLLVMEVPNLASAMARRRADRWGAIQPGELHISHFTTQSLEEVVGRAGFEVLAIDTVAPWHYIPPGGRWRHRALLGYAYRAASLRTLRATHPSGFDHLRLVARGPR